ncbi:hypothetical protein NL676_021537 [Syzygium grande]|nr:hypothetical protein NL676_021537 [Syzygium grande]
MLLVAILGGYCSPGELLVIPVDSGGLLVWNLEDRSLVLPSYTIPKDFTPSPAQKLHGRSPGILKLKPNLSPTLDHMEPKNGSKSVEKEVAFQPIMTQIFPTDGSLLMPATGEVDLPPSSSSLTKNQKLLTPHLTRSGEEDSLPPGVDPPDV